MVGDLDDFNADEKFSIFFDHHQLEIQATAITTTITKEISATKT